MITIHKQFSVEHKLLINTLDVPLLILDSNLNCLLISDQATRITGWEEDDIIHNSIKEYIPHTEKELLNTLQGDITKKKTAKGKFLIKEGKLIDILFTLKPYTDDKFPKSILVNLAIPKDESLSGGDLNEKLEKVEKEFKEYSYIVSHDLKAPLRAIRTLAEWLVGDYADKFDEQGKELVDLIMSRTNRMSDMIEGLLQFSRTMNKSEDKVEININSILEEIIITLKVPPHIQINIKDNIPSIKGEKTKIIRLYTELIKNAVLFNDKEKGMVDVGFKQENNQVIYSIKDNGPGIAEHNRERIFNIFQTLKPKDEAETTGMGLTLANKIVEVHNGKLWLESEEGTGSTFYFTIEN